MPGKATNKTDFQRYVNDHPTVVPGWDSHLEAYKLTPHKNKEANGLFGFWMRVKYRTKFDAAYGKFWLKNTQLHDKVYDNVVQECVE